MPTTPSLANDELSKIARRLLKNPRRRGRFRDLDAARAQQALLSVADKHGQARLYWLIELPSERISDARYLAFGSLTSHPIMEIWTERVRGLSLDEAVQMPLTTIEAELRDDEHSPAFGEQGLEPLDFIRDLQAQAVEQRQNLRILPKPAEVERYVRKREQDWDEYDRAWLPLSLMKKIIAIQDLGQQVLRERLGGDYASDAWELDGVNDDFQVRIDFSRGGSGKATPLTPEQRPLVLGWLREALQARLHPALTVEEVSK